MCPVKEKCGRTFGVLLSGGTIFAGDWLITMAKVAGQLTLTLTLALTLTLTLTLTFTLTIPPEP